MKRLFDLVLAIIVIALAIPIFVGVAVAIKIDSPGPVLFRQRRVGLLGSHFLLLKFRSMVVDASSLGGHSTADSDPRITRVGKFIRRTSLDELPQLVNVIRGEMSIVGPRPSVPAQQAEYSPADWSRRLSVKPGITGLAQVHGRSNATTDDRLMWDLNYVANHGVRADVSICVKTVAQLLRGGSN